MNQPLTLAAACTLGPDDLDLLEVAELSLSDAERERVATVWLWLCGVAPGSADAERVRREVLSDAGLIVACSLPAAEFVRWLRAAAWADFDSTDRTGSEAWAWAALQRAWGACESLGALALQVPIGGKVG